MRELIIRRIEERVGTQSGSYCWEPAAKYIARVVLGIDPDTKASRKLLPDIKCADRFALERMTDDELVDYFELIMRRFYTQM